GSVGRALSAVHSSAATAATLGSRCGGFSTWFGWKCHRRASDARAWIRPNFCRSTEEVVDCCPVVFVCPGRRCICCLCNYSAACKRSSSCLAQLQMSGAHRYGNYGSQRLIKPPRHRCAAFKAVFVTQAVLTLPYGHF